VNAAVSYDKYGPSPRCIQNVGMDLANFVYRFVGEGEFFGYVIAFKYSQSSSISFNLLHAWSKENRRSFSGRRLQLRLFFANLDSNSGIM